MTHFRFWQVDAFTHTPFKGNPAGVLIHEAPLESAVMQNIAAEINLSETAFVYLRENKNPILRWFTPVCEVDLCGHATLAAAHVYFKEVAKGLDHVHFETRFAGVLNVRQQNDSITLEFPLRPGTPISLDSVSSLVLESLSTHRPIAALMSRDLLLVYAEPQMVFDMQPDFRALSTYLHPIIVTAPSPSPAYDFISRYFSVPEGISEDPVTGSAHCTLAPYWAERLRKTEMKAYQASIRGGELSLSLKKDILDIMGDAVTVLTGTMEI